ncbi:uncharacterized protein V6R79_000264, partial [Siganus canaliculatus]
SRDKRETAKENHCHLSPECRTGAGNSGNLPIQSSPSLSEPRSERTLDNSDVDQLDYSLVSG